MTEAAQDGSTSRRPTSSASSEAINKALHEVATAPWVDVATFATVFDVGLNAAYREARAGRFGALRIGGQYRVPTAPLREALRLSPAAPSSDQVAA